MASRKITTMTTYNPSGPPRKGKKKGRNRNRRVVSTTTTSAASVNNPVMRAPKKKKQKRRMTNFQLHLAECTDNYMKALINPFQFWSSVCVPDLDVRPSSKIRLVLRNQLAIGTAGFGFALLYPYRTGFADGAGNSSLFSSLATFPGTASTFSGAGVQQSAMTTAPYLIGNVGGNLQGYRLAACGIRVRYTGTELNRGGRIVALFAPGSNDALTSFGISNMLAFRTAKSWSVTRSWRELIWYPRTPEEYAYTPNLGTNYFSDVSRSNAGTMLFGFEGVVGNTFEVEVVSYVEYVGTTLNQTPSHSDINGFSALRNAIGEVDITAQGGTYAYNTIKNAMLTYGAQATSYVGVAAGAYGATSMRNRNELRRANQLPL